MAILYVGIDLAKNVFAVHGVDEHGKAVLVRHRACRAPSCIELVAALPPCTIGMEACSGAHHWARLFAQHGHTVRLMAPKFVAPYRMSGKRGKNDAADAAAICEAVQRPNMRFVPVKSQDEQAGCACTACAKASSSSALPRSTASAACPSEGVVRASHLAAARIWDCPARPRPWAWAMQPLPRCSGASWRWWATAREFDSGRQLAAWLGLVPGQYSSGGKARLGRITKAGDAYLRSLLVLGARAVLNAAAGKTDSLSRWALALAERRGYWKAVVAIAAKNARMAWAVLTKGETFKLPA